MDRREEVIAALREQSQFHPDGPTTAVTVTGRAMTQTYNQVVQTIYKDEMRRSYELAEAIAEGTLARSPVSNTPRGTNWKPRSALTKLRPVAVSAW
jgi:hypothetical protein